MTIAVPTAPPTTVGSPLQHLKRKLHSGKSETYDLGKVIDIDIRIHIGLFKISKLIH